jgi:membrane-bound lytic murein transglycosylase D
MFGDWNLVLAAYNWGEANVQRLIDRSGLNDFWHMMDLRRNFPQETQNHVPLIMASIILARNPEKYGLPTDRDQPVSYDEVNLPRPIDLRAAGGVLGIPVDTLKQLNPALRGFSTPSDFQLKIPEGISANLMARLSQLPPPKPEPVVARKTHKVRRGDTLQKIAARYRVSVEALTDANDLDSRRVTVGSLLIIPSARASARLQKSSGKRTASIKAGKSASLRSDLTARNRSANSGKAAASSSKALASAKKQSTKKSGNSIKVQQASAR